MRTRTYSTFDHFQLNATHTVISGGYLDSAEYSNKSYLYSWPDKSWTPLGHLRTSRNRHACTVDMDMNGRPRVIVAGGRTRGREKLNSIEILDVATGEWQLGTALERPLEDSRFVTDPDEGYPILIGGKNELDEYSRSSN